MLRQTRRRAWRGLLLLPGLALGWGCDDGPTVPQTEPAVGAVVGTVRVATTGQGVAGALVSVGSISTTTGTNGRYELTGLPVGPITIRASATGFEDLELATSIPDFLVTRNLALTRRESLAFGDWALYAPAGPREVRAVLVALGGPDTRGFAAGTPFGAPVPEVEAALQDLGERFRDLAASRGIAVLGTSVSAMENGPAGDETILDALREAAAVSGRPELAVAPLLLYGISGGAPEASGFVARNPERAAALFLKVPAGVETPSGDAALGVPTYMVLAELDAFVDNGALTAAFEAGRAAGAPWARALERNVIHHSLSPAQRTFTLSWMRAILDLRLGPSAGSPLQPIEASGGWLGDAASGDVAAWAEFEGDRDSASWLPSEETAAEWQSFGALRGPSGHTVALDRSALTVSLGRIDFVTASVFDAAGRRVRAPLVQFSSNADQHVRIVTEEYCGSTCPDLVVIWAASTGGATVTAEYQGARDEASVTVVPALGMLVIEPAEATIPVGGTVLLSAKLLDGDGLEVPDPPGWVWWWGTDWDWDGGASIARVTFVPETNQWQVELTGLATGTVVYTAGVDGPLGPDPATTASAVVTVE